ncbi:MAG: hypothetical protein E6Q95_01715 [Chitinophagaceae bacterium]|nr:MAG: hypothetical protein E6Q95_01715 [Chitinophagaceae bacterium]
MKKFIQISMMLVALMVAFASCTRNDYWDDNNDYNNYYTEGRVSYVSEVGSPYSVVRLSDGRFAAIFSTDQNDELWPLEDERLGGDFKIGGERRVKNLTGNFNCYIEVDALFSSNQAAISYVIGREDSEGYAAKFKSNNKIVIRKTSRTDIKIK